MDDLFYRDTPPESRSRRKQILIAGLCAIPIFFMLDDIIGLLSGGGIFSVTSALDAARNGHPLIDVDDAGLRTLFVALCGLSVTAIGLQLNIDVKKRLTSLLFMVAIIGGGFVLDGLYGDKIVAHFMAGYGYSRCEARDHSEGTGKSRVAFDDYVRDGRDCPLSPITIVPSPSPLPADPRGELPRPARPIVAPVSWFSNDDYPAEALRDNQEGVTTAKFVVDTAGRVTNCAAAQSSGSQSLDATTCAILVTNGRYWPARDASGKAVAQTGSFRIRWEIPRG